MAGTSLWRPRKKSHFSTGVFVGLSPVEKPQAPCIYGRCQKVEVLHLFRCYTHTQPTLSYVQLWHTELFHTHLLCLFSFLVLFQLLLLIIGRSRLVGLSGHLPHLITRGHPEYSLVKDLMFDPWWKHNIVLLFWGSFPLKNRLSSFSS